MSTNRYAVQIESCGISRLSNSFATLNEANDYVEHLRQKYSPDTEYRIFKLTPVEQAQRAA